MNIETQYVIVSQEGMTPFATATNKKEALRLSRRAKMLGFSGQIVKYDRQPAEDDQREPPVMIQINDGTFRIIKFKEHGYAIHKQRPNGSWKRFLRVWHLPDQNAVETAIHLIRETVPVTA